MCCVLEGSVNEERFDEDGVVEGGHEAMLA